MGLEGMTGYDRVDEDMGVKLGGKTGRNPRRNKSRNEFILLNYNDFYQFVSVRVFFLIQ